MGINVEGETIAMFSHHNLSPEKLTMSMRECLENKCCQQN